MLLNVRTNCYLARSSSLVTSRPANSITVFVSKPRRAQDLRTCCQASTTKNNDASAAGDNKSAPRAMSPDILAMFNEAQKNIMELNRSRLKALEELKVAKQKISELEKQLDDARNSPVVRAPAKQTSSAASPVGSSQQQQQQVAAPPAAAPPPTPVPTDGVLVVYETGWDVAFLHFNADGRGWTQVPGQKMEPGQGEYSNCKVLKVDCGRLEFVVTNGRDWDSPDPSGSGKQNYQCDGPGIYKLKRGKLQKVQ